MKWKDSTQKECGHEAMLVNESFTCQKRSCPYPYNSNGTIWNQKDVDAMEDWIENGQKTPEIKKALRNANRELLIQLLWTEELQR